MTDRFHFDTPDSSENPNFQERAGNFAVNQLRESLPQELISIDGSLPNGIFKPSDGQTEVGRVLILANINLIASSDPTNLDKLIGSLSSITTNKELSDDLIDFINRANFIRELLLHRGKKIFILGFLSQRITSDGKIMLSDLGEFIKEYSNLDVDIIATITSFLSVLFNEDKTIEFKALEDFLSGHITYQIPIVYKRILDGRFALEREISFYRLLAENGFNTLCALSITPLSKDTDQYEKEGAYEFTLEQKGMVTFREDAYIIDESNGILLTFFSELARLHSLKIFHGDPHFENIAYRVDENGHVIIIFDLVRTSIQRDSEGSQRRLDFDLSIVISNISKSLSDTKTSSTIEEKNEAIDYVSRCYHTYLDSLDASGTFSQEIIEATRQTLAQAIVEHKILLGID